MGNTPDNNSRNQYLNFNICSSKFTSNRFNNNLAKNRITKEEVDDYLEKINLKFHNDFKNEQKFFLSYFIFLGIITAIYIYVLMTQGVEGKSDEMTQIQIFAIIIYILLNSISVCLLIFLVFRNQKKVQREIQKYVTEMNDSLYESRGILWNVIYANKAKYMQLMFISPTVKGKVIQGESIIPVGQPLLN